MNSYIAIMRLEHAFKHVFAVPGVLTAMYFVGFSTFHLQQVVLGFFVLVAASSANYTINEWLDRDFDRNHPKKKNRPAAKGLVSSKGVVFQYILLAAVSLAVSLFVGRYFFYYLIIFLIAGLAYNVPPVRMKDIPHVDVILESLNNPLRFILGWFMIVETAIIPPSSILLAYWAAGAYLMTVKRISDIATVADRDTLFAYRPSLARVTPTALAIQSNLAALASVLFLTVFVVKYRIEMLIPMFGVVLLFAIYGPLLSGEDGLAQTPEYLYKSKILNILVISLVVLGVGSLFMDFPWLSELLVPQAFLEPQ